MTSPTNPYDPYQPLPFPGQAPKASLRKRKFSTRTIVIAIAGVLLLCVACSAAGSLFILHSLGKSTYRIGDTISDSGLSVTLISVKVLSAEDHVTIGSNPIILQPGNVPILVDMRIVNTTDSSINTSDHSFYVISSTGKVDRVNLAGATSLLAPNGTISPQQTIEPTIPFQLPSNDSGAAIVWETSSGASYQWNLGL